MAAGAGFGSYVETGEVGEDFVRELRHLVSVVYGRWSLKVTEEDFYGFCLEHTVSRLPYFDPERGAIQNYVYTMVVNEARRVYAKERRRVDVDDEFLDLLPRREDAGGGLRALVQALYDFAAYAYGMGVYIGQAKVLSDLQEGVLSPEARAFSWLRETGVL